MRTWIRALGTAGIAPIGLAGCAGLWWGSQSPEKARDVLGLTTPPAAEGNPLTSNKIVLGRALFFDERLSKDGTLSCASCHVPQHGFTEPHAVSHGIGVNARRRNTPTVLNSAFERSLDWDGRAASLEDQVLGVFLPSGDMGIDIGEAVAIVRRDPRYRKLFVGAFDSEPTVDGLVKALAAFQTSLVSGNSRFDRFYFGGDRTALTVAEQRGWALFNKPNMGCAGCHLPLHPDPRGRGAALFTDRSFHNLGVGYKNGRMSDVGRYAVTQNPRDWGAFKTPGLRNVALTGPYMHDGSLATLEDVIEFYVRGGIANPKLDVVIRPLELSASEKADLVSFLRSLTSEELRDRAAVERTWSRYMRR
jgi:cytochrome c peroxidase